MGATPDPTTVTDLARLREQRDAAVKRADRLQAQANKWVAEEEEWLQLTGGADPLEAIKQRDALQSQVTQLSAQLGVEQGRVVEAGNDLDSVRQAAELRETENDELRETLRLAVASLSAPEPPYGKHWTTIVRERHPELFTEGEGR